MVKRENQRNASVLGCEQSKDHYVANPFTSTSVKVQVHGSSNSYIALSSLRQNSVHITMTHANRDSILSKLHVVSFWWFRVESRRQKKKIYLFLNFCPQQKKPVTYLRRVVSAFRVEQNLHTPTTSGMTAARWHWGYLKVPTVVGSASSFVWHLGILWAVAHCEYGHYHPRCHSVPSVAFDLQSRQWPVFASSSRPLWPSL